MEREDGGGDVEKVKENLDEKEDEGKAEDEGSEREDKVHKGRLEKRDGERGRGKKRQ